MRTLPIAVLLVLLVAVPSASAQSGGGAGDLASPFGTGARPAPTDTPAPSAAPSTQADVVVTTPAAPSTAPSAPPPSYDAVSVPPPPGAPALYAPATPAVTGASTDVRIPSSIATRIRALDADLQILAARGGGSIVDGVLAILTGGVSITIGILLNGPPSNYLYVYGAIGAARGILSLSLMTNPSASAIQYSHMSMASRADVRARLRYGEQQLDALADMARIARILDGSLNIAAGLAVIPVYLGPTNFAFTNPFDYFVLIGAGISVVSGIITLVSTTEAERRQGAYHELRDRLLATPEGAADEEAMEEAAAASGEASVQVTPSFAVMPGGGFASVSGTF